MYTVDFLVLSTLYLVASVLADADFVARLSIESSRVKNCFAGNAKACSAQQVRQNMQNKNSKHAAHFWQVSLPSLHD